MPAAGSLLRGPQGKHGLGDRGLSYDSKDCGPHAQLRMGSRGNEHHSDDHERIPQHQYGSPFVQSFFWLLPDEAAGLSGIVLNLTTRSPGLLLAPPVSILWCKCQPAALVVTIGGAVQF